MQKLNGVEKKVKPHAESGLLVNSAGGASSDMLPDTPLPKLEPAIARAASPHHVKRKRRMMGEISRQSSRRTLQSEDDRSLTTFPNPSVTSLEAPMNNGPLQSLLDHAEPSMFDESRHPDMDSSPQSLSGAPAHVIQDVIDHQGAVKLVRRLASLLAERDAHITALTRLAEEYKVPIDRISAAASRVRQAEERRLALQIATDEEFLPSAPQDISVRYCSNILTRNAGLTAHMWIIGFYSLAESSRDYDIRRYY